MDPELETLLNHAPIPDPQQVLDDKRVPLSQAAKFWAPLLHRGRKVIRLGKP